MLENVTSPSADGSAAKAGCDARDALTNELAPRSIIHPREPLAGLDLPRLDSALANEVAPSQFSTVECLSAAMRTAFVHARDQLAPELRAFLTCYSVADYDRSGVRLFISSGGCGGYGLKGDQLISLFSLRTRGLGKVLVRDALARGARSVECFDVEDKLPGFYRSFGFLEVARMPWNDHFAPSGWNYERFGRPDVVTMRLEV